MNLTVLIVYNRLANLQHWFHCWQQCVQSSQLVVIHNSDGEAWPVPQGVVYIKRKNIGFDIGAFQDVCRDRLKGFPANWDKLLWITDDTFPMVKDFASPFFTALDHGYGVAAMEISPYVRQHIRTTGFAITKKVANQLVFPADPVVTKEHCYQFEHRSLNHFLSQIQTMKLRAIMVTTADKSPLYDTGYGRRIKTRESQHYNLFGRTQPVIVEPEPIPKDTVVTFICPIYHNYPQIISALLCQTYKHWQLYLIHDGPGKIDLPDDPRIHYTETEKRAGNWGHSIRSEWIKKVNGDYLVITNPDNYITPTFIEFMLKGFKPGIVGVYCSEMVHSYKSWQTIPCSMRRGYVDCSGVMLRLDTAKEVGWVDVTSHSADWFFFERIIQAKGLHSFAKVPGCLLVHN